MTIKFDTASVITFGNDEFLSIKLNEFTDKIAATKFVSEMQKRPYVAELKRYSRKRTLDMNSYCWVMCQKLAEVLSIKNEKPFTDKEVYVKHIKEVGHYDKIYCREDAAEAFIREWGYDRIGRVAEIDISSNCRKGWVCVNAYHGSSDYNVDEMSRLLDSIIWECKDNDIDVEPPEKIEKMKAEWQAKEQSP